MYDSLFQLEKENPAFGVMIYNLIDSFIIFNTFSFNSVSAVVMKRNFKHYMKIYFLVCTVVKTLTSRDM